MSAHTPGPWIVGAHFANRLGGRTYIPILRPGNDPVPLAVVHRDVDGYGQAEGEANARVFAAAYALLAALKGVVRVADRNTVEFDAARDAIAAAEGRLLSAGQREGDGA